MRTSERLLEQLQQAGIVVALMMMLMLLTPLRVQAQQDYTDGVELYGKKNYGAAANCFLRAWTRNPNNLAAGYYAGYSYALAGRRELAIPIFWKLVDEQPDKKEAIQAKQMLASIDPKFREHKSPQTNQVTAAPARVEYSADQLINQLVEVVPPRGKIPATTPAFADGVKGGMAKVPLPILKFLVAKGAHIKLMPSVVEYDYRFQNTQPRGYGEGQSYKECPAFAEGKNVVCGQYQYNSRTESYSDRADGSEIGTIRHELGHVLDYCLNEASSSETFKHAYLLDAAKVPEEHRRALNYYLQTSDAGPSETFAELCCYEFGGGKGARGENTELLHSSFPTARLELQKLLNAIR